MTVDVFGVPWWQPRWAPVGEGAGGEGNGDGAAGDGAGADQAAPPPGDANGGGQRPGAGGTKEFTPITSQEQFDLIFSDRLKRTRTSLTKEIRSQLEAEAEEARQQESGQFKELAEKRGTKIADLERDLTAAQERLTKYDELAEKEYEEALKTLPEAITDFAPDPAADAWTKRQWLTEKALPAAAKLGNGEAKPKPPGLKPKDPPNKKDGILDLEAIERNYADSGIYNRM